LGLLKSKIPPLLLLVSVALAQQKTGEVAFYGNNAIPDWELGKIMRTKESPWYKKLLGSAQDFNSRQLENDLRIVKEYYRSRGFLDVNVTASARFKEDEKYLHIDVNVIEGAQYILDSLILTGDFPAILPREEIEKLILSETEKPINPKGLKRDARAIQRHFQNRGYPYADVTGDYEITGDSSATAIIKVNPGRIAYFGSVTYSGLILTRESVLKRELALEYGEKYSAKKITTSKEALYRTGLFTLVSIEPLDFDSQPETLDCRITVAEKHPRWIISRIGAGSDEKYDLTGEAALGWGHRNLFGTGREFTIQATSKWQIITAWSNLRNRFDVTYREPWTLGTRTPVTLDLYFEPGNSEEIDQYKIQIVGFEIGAEHSTSRRFTHSVYFNYEWADIYDITDPGLQQQILGERKPISRRIGYSAVRDNRDNVLVPTYGSYFAAQTEIAGYFIGGDEHYTKVSLSYRRYLSIFDRFVLANRGRIAVIGNWNPGEDVLPHQRFFLGGANTIRGWQERSIGPVDEQGNPRGGKLVMLGNVEFRAPLAWRLWGHIFFDTGNLWDFAETFNPDDLKGSAGWGLALITPVGPIRFDYGYQIMNADEAEPGEEISNSNWHLSLMYAF